MLGESRMGTHGMGRYKKYSKEKLIRFILDQEDLIEEQACEIINRDRDLKTIKEKLKGLV